MEHFFEWLKANWPLIASWGVIIAVFGVYLVRRIRQGETQQLIAAALAFVREMAKQAQAEIDREDVAFIVGRFYDELLAGTDLAKLISREFLVEQVWTLWQKHVRVEVAAQTRMRSKVQRN